MGHWVFEELRGGPRRTPQEAELFKDDQSAEGEYAGNDHLVREVLQNSLDARDPKEGGPVRVRLALHDAHEAPPRDRLIYYFARLKEPLAGRDFDFTRSGAPKSPCRYLVCEDFATRGLEGNPALFNDPTPSSKSDEGFYWFWRNIGRSGKTGEDLGRWGLGKTVFRAVSRVGCMFGLTVRASDRASLLMGQAVLQPHSHRGVEYHPEGYWCRERAEALPMPITSVIEVAEFRREWRLTRNGEPGTSVVAPFVPDELNAERILQAVIVHFFTRIQRGQLEVDVADAALGQINLRADSIEHIASQIEWSGSKRMKRHQPPPLAFSRRCLASLPTYSTTVLGMKRAPDLNDEAIPADDLQNARRQLADGELVSVRVCIALPRRDGADDVGAMDVYLRRASDGQRHDSYYVREGMTITKLNSTAGRRGVQALVIVDSGPMARFLGDAEGPAHEDWSPKADRLLKDWKSPGVRVKFARKVIDRVVEYLAPPSAGPDRDLLADFFSLEKYQGHQRTPKLDAKAAGDGSFQPPPVKPKWFHIYERAGGFTVARNKHVPMPADAVLDVAFAYDLPRGNPLTNWSPIDFEISKRPGGMLPKLEGVAAKVRQGNTVRLYVRSEEFAFSIDGFDRSRDLYVRVDDLSGADGIVEEAAHD